MADVYNTDSGTTDLLAIGGSSTGTLAGNYDSDRFKVHLEAGKPYIFTLAGEADHGGTLRNLAYVDLELFDSSNYSIAVSYGTGLSSFSARVLPGLVDVTGDYTLAVSTFSWTSGGSYTLSAILQPPDDYAAGITTKGVLTVGEAMHAKAEMAGDADWFKFHVEAGQHYIYSTTGSDISVDIRLYDVNGKAITAGTYPFEPAGSGDYYLSATGTAVGNYAVTVKTIVDDYSANASTPGQLSEGGQADGIIQFAYDKDSFQFTMEAGRIYNFDLATANGNAASTLDLHATDSSGLALNLVTLRSQDGVLHVSAAPTQSGIFLLTVSSDYSSITNLSYTLHSVNSQLDDYGNSIATASALEIGAQISGSIQSPTDIDMLKVELQAGVAYNFMLQPQDNQSTMNLDLQDDKGHVLSTASSSQKSNVYVPSISGTYYLAATAYSGQQLSYTLTTSLADDDFSANNATTGALAIGAPAIGQLEAIGDRDWFATSLNAGNTYWFTLSGSGDTPLSIGYSGASVRIVDSKGALVATTDSSTYSYGLPVLSFAPSVRGTYYVEVSSPNKQTGIYQLQQQIGVRDDFGGDSSHAGKITLDTPLGGTLELGSDKDVLKFSAVAGTTYRIDMAPPGGGSLGANLKVTEGLQDTVQQRTVSNTGSKTTILFEAAHTGDYYFTLSNNGWDTNKPQSYVITTSSYGLDDFAGNGTTSGVLPMNGQIQGSISYPDDTDWVKVHLESGRTYVFDMRGWQSGGGTLETVNLVGLTLYGSGSGQVASQNYPVSGEPHLTYTATSTGDYYLEAHGNGYQTGSYTLGVTQATGDLTAPQLLSATPVDGSGGFSPTGKLVLTFSEKVALPSNSSFTLTGGGTTMNLSGSYAVNVLGQTVVIDPSANLRPGTTYTLQVASGMVIDLAGNKYAGGSLSFTTVAAVAAGTEGNDFMVGQANGQQLSGGNGIDTVYYGGSESYTVTRNSSNVTTVQQWFGGTGDVLTGVERLLFANQAKALDIDGHGGQAYRLYQAAFNRTPDSAGLGFWMSKMDNGQSLQSVAHDFVASDEFIRTYGAKPSDADFVNLLYHNVLHRDGEAAGVAHWLQVLHNGDLRENVLVAFSESAENQAALIGQIGNGFWYTPYG